MRRRRSAAEPGADPGVVSAEVAARFREAMGRLSAGAIDEAVQLFEESADLEGGEGGAIARAQVVRMLIARGHMDPALGLYERSAAKDADIRWRTLGDLLEPLVRGGRVDDALGCLIASAESVREARDFNAAFTGIIAVLQGVRVPPEVDQRILAALGDASGERLDARLAVERLRAARAPQGTETQASMVRLAGLAGEALAQGDRELEARALTTLLSVVTRAELAALEQAPGEPPSGGAGAGAEAAGAEAAAGGAAGEDATDSGGLLYEQPAVEQFARRIGERATLAAATTVTTAGDVARAEGRLVAAAALRRMAAVLWRRAGNRDAALEAARAALEGAREAGEQLAEGDALTIAAWLAGTRAEPEVWDEGDDTHAGGRLEGSEVDSDDDDDDEDIDDGLEDDLEVDDVLRRHAADDDEGEDDDADDGYADDDEDGDDEGAILADRAARLDHDARLDRDADTDDDEAADATADADAEPPPIDGPTRSPIELPRRPLALRIPGDAAPVRIGERPRLPAGVRWPRCAGCGDGMTFVAELRVPDAPLGGDFRRALVFACNVAPWVDGYESRCDAGAFPFAGGGTVLLIGDEGDLPSPPRLGPLGTPELRPRAYAPANADLEPRRPSAAVGASAAALAAAPEAVAPPPAEPSGNGSSDGSRAGGPGEPETGRGAEGGNERGAASAPAADPDDTVGPCLGGPGPEGAAICPRCQRPLVPLLRLGGRRAPAVHIVNHGWLHVLVCSAACSGHGICFWQPGAADG